MQAYVMAASAVPPPPAFCWFELLSSVSHCAKAVHAHAPDLGARLLHAEHVMLLLLAATLHHRLKTCTVFLACWHSVLVLLVLLLVLTLPALIC
jgi:hypothetical protein